MAEKPVDAVRQKLDERWDVLILEQNQLFKEWIYADAVYMDKVRELLSIKDQSQSTYAVLQQIAESKKRSKEYSRRFDNLQRRFVLWFKRDAEWKAQQKKRPAETELPDQSETKKR